MSDNRLKIDRVWMGWEFDDKYSGDIVMYDINRSKVEVKLDQEATAAILEAVAACVERSRETLIDRVTAKLNVPLIGVVDAEYNDVS